MENEFWIEAELLSFGGSINLQIIPFKNYFQVILDDFELCTLRKNKDGQWVEFEGDLNQETIDYIGSQIDNYLMPEEETLKRAS